MQARDAPFAQDRAIDAVRTANDSRRKPPKVRKTGEEPDGKLN